MTYIESGIELSFGSNNVMQIGDDELGHGLRNVDFIVRETQRLVLVEVKATGNRPHDYLSDAKLNELVEKARDTYTFLHLTSNADLPRSYVVVIDFGPGVRLEGAEMVARHDSLRARLRGEKGHSWSVEYINAVFLLTPDTLSDFFDRYTATRQ